MKKEITRKIGNNRGKTRLWIEGDALQKAGWTRGTRYRVEFNRGEVVYIADPEGPRKVAGTEERPIIDTNTDKLKDALETDGKTADKGTVCKIITGAQRITVRLAAVVLAGISFGFIPADASKVLIGCEFSGTVRDAFTRAGHWTISCDLREAETPGRHYRGDVRDLLAQEGDFDLAVFHPPCTELALSGARWATDHFVKCQKATPATHPTFMIKDGVKGYWHDGSAKRAKQKGALDFFRECLEAPINRVAVENPMSIASRIAPKDQTVQPWEYGHGEKKTTWLWLKNLPHLVPTEIVPGREEKVWSMAPGPEREKERSRFFPGIAAAMADQWGRLLA